VNNNDKISEIEVATCSIGRIAMRVLADKMVDKG
jgi:hypothetical protein